MQWRSQKIFEYFVFFFFEVTGSLCWTVPLVNILWTLSKGLWDFSGRWDIVCYWMHSGGFDGVLDVGYEKNRGGKDDSKTDGLCNWCPYLQRWGRLGKGQIRGWRWGNRNEKDRSDREDEELGIELSVLGKLVLYFFFFFWFWKFRKERI